MRVLIVEDNPVDAEIARRAVQRTLRCAVDVVTDGEAAVAALTGEHRSLQDEPDLILLDLGLPTMSGLEVLRRLRREASYQRTPIVILTTAVDDETITESYAAGASSFLVKPATDVRFADALRALTAGVRPAKTDVALTSAGS